MESFSPDTSLCCRDPAPAQDMCSQARHASSLDQSTTYNETTRVTMCRTDNARAGVTDRWLDCRVIGGGGAFSSVVVPLVVW